MPKKIVQATQKTATETVETAQEKAKPKAPARKTATKKTAVTKKAVVTKKKVAAAKSTTTRKTTAGQTKTTTRKKVAVKKTPVKPAAPSLTAEQQGEITAKLAYFLAEQRNFAPGDEQQDWLYAEEVLQLALSDKPIEAAIERLAWLVAAQRDFAPGHEERDWFLCEQEIQSIRSML